MKSHLYAKHWNGAKWFGILCSIFIGIIIIYILAHQFSGGHEFKKLDGKQTQQLTMLVAMYPDSHLTALHLIDPASREAVRENRVERNKQIISYLQNEYDSLDDKQILQMNQFLVQLNSRDVVNYLSDKQFYVNSYFWLKGPGTYLEVLFWTLIGVLASLIYYVSLANRDGLKSISSGIRDFDPAEIPDHVAKMLYAPVCTLILVLGYNYFSTDSKMIDISAAKGVLLFAFISGFFSGRVMVFLDNLKKLILPVGDAVQTSAKTDAAKTAVVATEVELSPTLAETEEGVEILEGGFNAAEIYLEPVDGGDVIALDKPDEDQGGKFTAVKVPFGKYLLKGKLAMVRDHTVVNVENELEVDVNESTKVFKLSLDKTDVEG